MVVAQARRPRRRFASGVLLLTLALTLTGRPSTAQTPERPLQTGDVWTWGQGDRGALGDGTAQRRATPAGIASLPDIVSIAASHPGNEPMVANTAHGLALDADGHVWAWGWNRMGQLGAGGGEQRNTPDLVPGLSNITAISAGGDHNLALDASGDVWTWGSDAWGQLGDGSAGPGYDCFPIWADGEIPADWMEPEGCARPSAAKVEQLSEVIAVAAGRDFSLAVRSDRTVWAWGRNIFGALGDGSTVDRALPVQVSGLGDITGIAGGGAHSLAVDADGNLWAWGWNLYGQLGHGSTGGHSVVPQRIEGVADITRLAAAYDHSLAVDRNGAVRGWGNNPTGAIGNGNGQPRPAPAVIEGMPKGVVDVSSVSSHSIAVLDDGSVWAWGSNFYGQLGDGTAHTYAVDEPVQVWGMRQVGAASAGHGFSMALKLEPTAPGEPRMLTGSAGPSSAELSWAIPPNGGSPLTGYEVEATCRFTGCDDEPVLTSVAGAPAVIEGLRNGAIYNLRVRASNVHGVSRWSAWSLPYVPGKPPGAPRNVQQPGRDTLPAWDAQGGTATISWEPPTAEDGVAADGYRITRHPGGQTDVGADIRSFDLPGLQYGAMYTVSVAAFNAYGVGVPEQIQVTPRSRPAPPTNVTGSPGVQGATVAWDVPVDTGVEITGYTVTAQPGDIQVETYADRTSATVSGLSEGREYTFVVQAHSSQGAGTVSSPSNPVTPMPPPVVNLSRTVSLRGATDVFPEIGARLAWQNQGAPDAIQVEWSDGLSRTEATLPGDATSLAVPLRPRRSYRLTVRAVRGEAASPPVRTKVRGTKLTSAVTRGSVAYGGATTVTGVLTEVDAGATLPKRRVQLQQRERIAAGAWSSWRDIGAPVRTDDHGTYAITTKPRQNMRFRVVFAGAGRDVPDLSPERKVAVAPALSAQLSRATVTPGTRVGLTGRAEPDLAGEAVHLQRYRDGRWRDVPDAHRRLSATSTYRFWVKPGPGTHRYRVRMPASPRFAEGLSPARTLRVS